MPTPGAPRAHAHLFAVLARPLNTGLEVSPPQVGTLGLAEPVIHEAVAQADGLFGLGKHHGCGGERKGETV